MSAKSLNLSGLAQGTALSVGTTATYIDITKTGDYSIWCDIDVYIKINTTDSAVVTTDTGWVLFSNAMPPPIRIIGGNRLQVIAASGSGTFRHHEIGVR